MKITKDLYDFCVIHSSDCIFHCQNNTTCRRHDVRSDCWLEYRFFLFFFIWRSSFFRIKRHFSIASHCYFPAKWYWVGISISNLSMFDRFLGTSSARWSGRKKMRLLSIYRITIITTRCVIFYGVIHFQWKWMCRVAKVKEEKHRQRECEKNIILAWLLNRTDCCSNENHFQSNAILIGFWRVIRNADHGIEHYLVGLFFFSFHCTVTAQVSIIDSKTAATGSRHRIATSK